MKRAAPLLTLTIVLMAAGALAQKPAKGSKLDGTRAGRLTATPEPESLGQITPTPEMWFYTQEMRRYDDSRASVRRRAHFKATQRHRRLTAMHWFGFSNSRPTTNPTAGFGGPASPTWTSNSWSPNQWSGHGRGATVLTARGDGGSYGLW